MKRIVFIITILALLSLSIPVTSDSSFSVEDVYSNPFRYIGKDIRWEGTIAMVMSITVPLGILVKTDGCLWYVEIFNMSKVERGAVKNGNEIFVRGSYLGKKQVLFRGSYIEIPSIYGTELRAK